MQNHLLVFRLTGGCFNIAIATLFNPLRFTKGSLVANLILNAGQSLTHKIWLITTPEYYNVATAMNFVTNKKQGY